MRYIVLYGNSYAEVLKNKDEVIQFVHDLARRDFSIEDIEIYASECKFHLDLCLVVDTEDD